MLKALKITALIVCAVLCLSGFKKQDTVEIVYQQQIYVEKYGDCFEGLIGKYYDKCNNGVTWEEYRYNMKKLNANLFKNGRALQVGDPILVEWYVERKVEK